MHKDRRDLRQIDSDYNDYHEGANNEPYRLSTADSGRGSMLFSDRSTMASGTAFDSIASPFSVDEASVVDKKLEEKPIRISRTHIIRGRIYEKAFVSHVDHPSAFFLQLYHQKKKFAELHSDIYQYYSKNSMSDPSKKWKHGEYCIAKFTDNAFYRARIIETPEGNNTQNQYDVVYIDFGNWGKVHSSDIHILLPKFAELSAQAIACTLSQALPRSHTWFEHPKAIDLFEALVYNKYVDAAFILRNDNDYWPLEFVELELSYDKINVRDHMKAENLIRIDSNKQFHIEFSQLFQRVDYLIYNIRHENSETNDTDDEDEN